MIPHSNLLRTTLACAALFVSSLAFAQGFPIAGKPLRIIVPFPAGGQTDIQARAIAAKLQPALGVPVIVENKPGASTILGTRELMKSAPDGHTLLYTIGVTAAQNPHMFSKLPYDPFKDLTPVMWVCRITAVLVVPAQSPFNSVKDLVNYAKAHPGKVTFASVTPGSSGHLAAELLAQVSNTQMTHVPFKGSSEASTALIGGHVDFLFDGATTALAFASAGKVKMLAHIDRQPYAALASVPTMGEAGYPDVVLTGGMQVFAPRGTPPAVVNQVNAALKDALKGAEMQKFFSDGGSEIVASTPAEHAAAVREQYERNGTLIRKLGLKMD